MRHFHYQNLTQLQQSCSDLEAHHVHFEPDTARVQTALFAPVRVGSFQVGNALAIHPMEGCDGTADGAPDTLTRRRYERFAQGGAKLVWFEATAVCPEGRANTRQLWITKANVQEFGQLLAHMRRLHAAQFGTSDDLLIPIQLTHSGRYSVPDRLIAYHHPAIDEKTNSAGLMPLSDSELERLEDQYVEAAGLVKDAGFDAIDIKIVHGYLLSELLGAKIREGHYGGSLENRTRLARNVLGKIRAKFGTSLLLGIRLGCFDSVPYRKRADGVGEPYPFETPYPHGFGVSLENPLVEDLTEVKAAIGLFREAGAAFFNISIGCPYYNPHVTRPFETPDDGNYLEPEHPLQGVDRHFRIAGELQRSFPEVPMVGAGYSWLQKYAPNAGAWNVANGNIRFFALGRGALAYPDFGRALAETGELEERRVCKTLTYCTYLMRQKNNPLGQFPTGCPPFDKEVYGPIVKEARAAQRAAALKT